MPKDKAANDDASYVDTYVASIIAHTSALGGTTPRKAKLMNKLVATKEDARGVNGELQVEHVQLEEWRVFKHRSLTVEVIRASLNKLHTTLDQTQVKATKNDNPTANPKAKPRASFDSLPYHKHPIERPEIRYHRMPFNADLS